MKFCGMDLLLPSLSSADGINNTLWLLLLFTTLCIIYKWKSSGSKGYSSLPGPINLPIVGYLPFIGTCPQKTFDKLKKKYGPVFRVQLGALSCLVIGNYSALQEAFVKQRETFSGRPKELSFKVFENESAFIYNDGDDFKTIRSFSVDALKKLGFGRSSLEPAVKDEVEKLMEEFIKLNGEPTDVKDILEKSVGNAVCTILCGKRSEYDDRWLIRVINAVNNLAQTYLNDFGLFFPWIKKIPFTGRLTKRDQKLYWKKELWRLWNWRIDDVKKNVDGSFGESFISSWLEEEKLKKEKNDPTSELFSEFSLKNNLDIFSQAAFDTTATTLLWCFNYLMSFPDKQKRVQKEIDNMKAKKGNDLSFGDLKEMPYLKAFLLETHRKASILPLGVFHSNIKETVLMGYHVPVRTVIISNQYSIHHDEKDFPNPHEFRPERFLNDAGEYVHCEKVVPFSTGRRFCPGEFVAQMQIFNFITEILHKFELKSPPGVSNDISAIQTNTILCQPERFKIVFLQRN